MPKLVETLSADSFDTVADSILTTDLRRKTASEEVQFQDGVVRVAGMTKGSGMIHPNMATTLGFVMTDAALEPDDLHDILLAATERPTIR